MEVFIFKDHLLNRQIRDREVRVIGSKGDQLGVMPTAVAQAMADEQNLDLVLISPTANPPVCKIIDYGKFKYEQGKRDKESRRNQKVVELKEVQLSPTIDVGDMDTKARHARSFLEDGNKVKVTIRMRGRQQARPELSLNVMSKFYDMVHELAVKENEPKVEGRNIFMILAPAKKI